MTPGDWVAVGGYDDGDATTALVTATSTHKAVIRRADADRLNRRTYGGAPTPRITTGAPA